jgi:hypothetical protein
MNAKNTATATKFRITKRIGRLAVAAAAATALALGSAPAAQAVTAREALDGLPLSCEATVTDGGKLGYMVEFSCPGPPRVYIVCVNREPCELMKRIRKTSLADAMAPTGQVTATGPANSEGPAVVQSNAALAASADAAIRQMFAPKTAVKVKATIAATTQGKGAPTVG